MEAELTEEERRKEALRKAGQEYFENVLKKAAVGRDPFAPAPSSSPSRLALGGSASSSWLPPTGRGPPRGAKAKAAALDADLQAAGEAVGHLRFAACTVSFLLCASTSMVLSKMSLEVLPAPNTILLMHMLPVAVVAYVAAAAGAWTCSPFSVALVRRATPFAALHAGMALMVLFALEHMRVETVLGVTCALAPVVTGQVAHGIAHPTAPLVKPTTPKLAALGVGAAAALLCIAAEGPNTMKAALWLLPWFIFLVLERAADAVHGTPRAVDGDATEDEGWRSKCHDALRAALEAVQGVPMGEADEEDEEGLTRGLSAKLTAGDRLLYCNLLPILPVAVFGALFQEANIFTDAELHVHSVSVIAYSVLAGLGMAVSSLLLREMLSAKAFAYSTVATQIGTLIILCLGADNAASQPDAMEGLVSAFVCVAAGTTFQHWPFTL